MTPLQIQMMIHYYSIAEPYAMRQPQHANSSAVIEQREELISLKLLQWDRASPAMYKTTEAGNLYVDLLCNMPIPTQLNRIFV